MQNNKVLEPFQIHFILALFILNRILVSYNCIGLLSLFWTYFIAYDTCQPSTLVHGQTSVISSPILTQPDTQNHWYDF